MFKRIFNIVGVLCIPATLVAIAIVTTVDNSSHPTVRVINSEVAPVEPAVVVEIGEVTIASPAPAPKKKEVGFARRPNRAAARKLAREIDRAQQKSHTPSGVHIDGLTLGSDGGYDPLKRGFDSLSGRNTHTHSFLLTREGFIMQVRAMMSDKHLRRDKAIKHRHGGHHSKVGRAIARKTRRAEKRAHAYSN